MKVRKKFPSKVACVHCNGGCRANQSPEGYDLCLYGCTGCGACMEVCRFGAISLNSYGVAEVDESRCIGCGACVASCKNASAMLFTSAKIAHLNLLPQGQPERSKRVLAMMKQMEAEGFGNCTNQYECEAACPKGISVDNIARLNRDFMRANAKEGLCF